MHKKFKIWCFVIGLLLAILAAFYLNHITFRKQLLDDTVAAAKLYGIENYEITEDDTFLCHFIISNDQNAKLLEGNYFKKSNELNASNVLDNDSIFSQKIYSDIDLSDASVPIDKIQNFFALNSFPTMNQIVDKDRESWNRIVEYHRIANIENYKSVFHFICIFEKAGNHEEKKHAFLYIIRARS